MKKAFEAIIVLIFMPFVCVNTLTSCESNNTYEYITRKKETSIIVDLLDANYESFMNNKESFFRTVDYLDLCIVEKSDDYKYARVLLNFENEMICKEERKILEIDKKIDKISESYDTPFKTINTISLEFKDPIFEVGKTLSLYKKGEYKKYIPHSDISLGGVQIMARVEDIPSICENVSKTIYSKMEIYKYDTSEGFTYCSFFMENEEDEIDYFLYLSIANYLAQMSKVKYVTPGSGLSVCYSGDSIWVSDFTKIDFDNFYGHPGKYNEEFEELKNLNDDGFIGNFIFRQDGEYTIKFLPSTASYKDNTSIKVNIGKSVE